MCRIDRATWCVCVCTVHVRRRHRGCLEYVRRIRCLMNEKSVERGTDAQKLLILCEKMHRINISSLRVRSMGSNHKIKSIIRIGHLSQLFSHQLIGFVFNSACDFRYAWCCTDALPQRIRSTFCLRLVLTINLNCMHSKRVSPMAWP